VVQADHQNLGNLIFGIGRPPEPREFDFSKLK